MNVDAYRKTCTKCGVEKSFDDFYVIKSGERVGQLRAMCKECIRQSSRFEMELENLHKGICDYCHEEGDLLPVGVCVNCAIENIPNRRRNQLSPNKKSPIYLHHLSKLILAMLYEDAEPTPIRCKDYSFTCDKSKKIKIISACKGKVEQKGYLGYRWSFQPKRNKAADVFLCIAFDDRENLNPLHIWAIPGQVINKVEGFNIIDSEVGRSRWMSYEIDLTQIKDLCKIIGSEA